MPRGLCACDYVTNICSGPKSSIFSAGGWGAGAGLTAGVSRATAQATASLAGGVGLGSAARGPAIVGAERLATSAANKGSGTGDFCKQLRRVFPKRFMFLRHTQLVPRGRRWLSVGPSLLLQANQREGRRLRQEHPLVIENRIFLSLPLHRTLWVAGSQKTRMKIDRKGCR